jgi:hypothetical protein
VAIRQKKNMYLEKIYQNHKTQQKLHLTYNAQVQQGVCHTMALPFTLKSIILRQKTNYGNSNISPCKNIIFKKNPLKETKILQDIITL